MHVGILGGTGPAGRGLAARLASVGLEVTIGSRSTDRARETCEELRRRWPEHDLTVEGADNPGAAAADLVVVATPWDAAASTTASVAESVTGKVVVSMANAVVKVGKEMQALVPPRGSIALDVQAAVPSAAVSAALHHLPARELGDIATPLEADVLVCADRPEAMNATMRLVSAVPGLRPLDAGSLSSAAAVEAFTAVLLNLNIRYKTRAAVTVTGVRAP